MSDQHNVPVWRLGIGHPLGCMRECFPICYEGPHVRMEFDDGSQAIVRPLDLFPALDDADNRIYRLGPAHVDPGKAGRSERSE